MKRIFGVYNTVNSLYYLLLVRTVKKLVRKYAFYVFGCSVILGLLLFALAVIMKSSTDVLLGILFDVRDSSVFWLFIKSMGLSISLITSAFYILKELITHRNSDFVKMMENLRISVFIREMVTSNNKIILLTLIIFIISGFMYFPSIFTSGLTLGMKLSLAIHMLFQIIFTCVVLELLFRFLYVITNKISQTYKSILLHLTLLLGITGYYYVLFVTGSMHQLPFDYQPVYWGSGWLSLFYPQVNEVAKVNFLYILGITVFVLVLYIFSHFFALKWGKGSGKSSLILGRKLKFLNGDRAIITKVVKELIRNQDVQLHFLLSFIILAVIKYLKPGLLEVPLAFFLVLSLSASNFLYAFSAEYSFKSSYIAMKMPPQKIFKFNLIATFLLFAVETLCFLWFIPYPIIKNNAFSALILLFVEISFLYLVGILVPVNKQNMFASSILIASIVLGLIPVIFIYISAVDRLGISIGTSNLIQLMAGGVSIFCAYRAVKKYYRGG